MSRPKIAFVTPGAFPLPSPNSSSVERVVEKFVPLLIPNIQARIYGRIGRSLPKRGKLGGAVCERYPAGNKRKYVGRVGRSLLQFSPDVTEVENRPGTVLSLKRLLPGGRVWLHLHSATFIGRKAIRPETLERSLQAAEKIIVNSEFLKEVIAARVPSCANKLRVVYPGVDTERFQSQFSLEGGQRRARLRDQRRWNGRSVVLFMGRLIEKKGVHHLLRLMPELVKRHPSVLLVVVGGAFYGSTRTTAYVRSLHRLGRAMPGHVQFKPYVPYSEVPDWFLGADIAVVPSGSREAFGLVNVEAMACGLPVVATRAGGMKEIIEDGVTGFLVSPAEVEVETRDRLLTLLQNEQLRLAMGIRSRERVEQQFTWHHTAARWLNLLRENGEL
ncbi:glycosyltransferase family 4 protein [Paenibacillus oenotherae]|uniref:Glycosyltransferase family 4 protein n=1 Tax=Paenibacillus oenotherae TaxID=1435645 RepID=A0ABS7D3R6_9BACL|nr:glycosyltransferase family 4 protein [Paenibacillus oenotherae]MBW7474496.1 glycosyltransferase family 4 protein [Paenibacillus oenotherae]